MKTSEYGPELDRLSQRLREAQEAGDERAVRAVQTQITLTRISAFFKAIVLLGVGILILVFAVVATVHH